MVAGGAGYAALSRFGDNAAARAGSHPVTLWPTGDGTPPGALLVAPGAIPVNTGSPSAPPTTPSGAQKSALPTAAGPVSTPSAGRTTTAGTRPTPPEHAPPPVADPPTTEPPPALGPGGAQLTATFTQNGRYGPNGISHVSGTVEVNNPTRRPADAWQVTIRIPGGNPVYGDGSVDVSQTGNRVTFAPYDSQLPPGASTTFSFTVGGVLSAAPNGCTINGRPCD
jgi:hypothetical protein